MEKKSTLPIAKLNIYFPWDDDLCTHFKGGGLGANVYQGRPIPLVAAEDTEITSGSKNSRRSHVIFPGLFGESFESLGWEETLPMEMPIIPSEKPYLCVHSDINQLTLKIESSVGNKEEYHLEFASRGGGRIKNVNWVLIYLRLQDFYRLEEFMGRSEAYPLSSIKKEIKENQRVAFYYLEVPIYYYEFSLGGFKHAVSYLRGNGYKNEKIPSIVYNSNKPLEESIVPIAKIGFEIGGEDSQNEPKYFVIKIAQTKESVSKRGKKAKKRGELIEAKNGNMALFNLGAFAAAIATLRVFVDSEKQNTSKI